MSSSFTRVLDRDTEAGTVTYFHYDATEDKVIYETVMDAEDILELNKAQYNSFDERSRFGDKIGPSTTVARIPLHIYFDLKRRGIADDEQALAKWLDDPANSGWRTRPGLLSRIRAAAKFLTRAALAP